jgi:tetratricopeptide (TPR) repeat protein
MAQNGKGYTMNKTETTERISEETVEKCVKSDLMSKDCSFSEFRALVHTGPEEEDYKKHYYLGITYLKMGLFEEASKEFCIAVDDPTIRIDCITKVGRCFSEMGEHGQALDALEEGLSLEGLEEADIRTLRHEIIKICEQTGARERADRELHKIQEMNVIYLESAQSPAPPSQDLYAAPPARLSTFLFFLLVGAALVMGWEVRDQEYLTAESGLGYALGVAGSVMMLLLLLYPLRKKIRFMLNWGPAKHWFQAHMILGLLGPAFILYHSNFQMGSMNSSVVLVSMLLVAGSGIVGRYFYTKIHYGLYGRQLRLKDLQKEIEIKRNSLGYIFHYAPNLKRQLLNFESRALLPPNGLLHSVARHLTIGIWTKWVHLSLRWNLRRALNVVGRRANWTPRERKRQGRIARSYISAHLAMVPRITRFSFFERLFSLWHMFHLPLFILLVIAGIVHVLAVHMY